ncbi:MAG: hypothetical protein ACLS5C_10105 [Waltera sp.]
MEIRISVDPCVCHVLQFFHLILHGIRDMSGCDHRFSVRIFFTAAAILQRSSSVCWNISLD